ncbi:MAG: TlpA disulfide reductase family protein [Saprospiraceae bacterium]
MKKYAWLTLPLVLAAVLLGRYLYFMPKYTNGKPAPEFEATLLDGSAFRLSDLKGQYILLDFWGSWCGPCRKQNPAIVDLYRNFHQEAFQDGEGFVVVNVGVETDSTRWQNAIVQDNLHWPYHVMDLSGSLRFFNGAISSLYGVRSVPTSYLINPKGEIIGVNMEPGQMDRLLRQKLSK